MRRVVVVVVVLVLVAGCSGSSSPTASKAFCRAADDYDSALEHQQKTGKTDIDRQIELVAELARTAPPKIEDDAQVFLDAMRQVEDDPSIKDDPDIREAVDNVNRLANQACGVYDRRSGI